MNQAVRTDRKSRELGGYPGFCRGHAGGAVEERLAAELGGDIAGFGDGSRGGRVIASGGEVGAPVEQAQKDYIQTIRDVVVVLMIEKKGAVDDLEEILSLPGLDMIQWGAADYTISVGRPGQWTSPETKAVEKRVFETALKMGVPPRCEINSPDAAKYYLDMGVRHFCIGADLLVWFEWCRKNGEVMRKALDGA